MNKKLIGLVSILIFIGVIVYIPFNLYRSYKNDLYAIPSQSSEAINVKIEQGLGTKEISSLLFEKGLIVNESVFYLYGRLSGQSNNIKAGEFEIPMNKTIPEIYQILSTVRQIEITISIPEGLRGDEIAQIIDKSFQLTDQTKLEFSRDRFLDIIYTEPISPELTANYEFLIGAVNLEGYLYPDTYNFFEDATAEDVIAKLLDTFELKAWPIIKEKKIEVASENFTDYDSLILASIVEREGLNSTERKEIASILFNRVNGKNGLFLLQADATLLYPLKNWDSDYFDKGFESPFNSYKYPGLPPTPICNPGIESIQAVMDSHPTENLYYLHKNGKFLTAKTYEMHIYNFSN